MHTIAGIALMDVHQAVHSYALTKLPNFLGLSFVTVLCVFSKAKGPRIYSIMGTVFKLQGSPVIFSWATCLTTHPTEPYSSVYCTISISLLLTHSSNDIDSILYRKIERAILSKYNENALSLAASHEHEHGHFDSAEYYQPFIYFSIYFYFDEKQSRLLPNLSHLQGI